ncbi:MAG: ABC transporter ATP-binding protein, partial [Parvibaculales bacterium]
MTAAISVRNVSKKYKNGFHALKNISLEVEKGEIFALLGPNGAGKTTLINSICGIVTLSSGSISVFGHDHIRDYRKARNHIGLVPQELATDSFETVWNTVSLTRGLFNKAPKPAHIEKVLKRLSLWDKKDSQVRMLSGGMKRRLLIAKALSHEPDILFLDEPTAGVDVELRKSMWRQIKMLRKMGVTIILTTHYIEEAEEIAERIGIIRDGKIILTEKKKNLIKNLGKKEIIIHLDQKLKTIPPALKKYSPKLVHNNQELIFCYDPDSEESPVQNRLDVLYKNNIAI